MNKHTPTPFKLFVGAMQSDKGRYGGIALNVDGPHNVGHIYLRPDLRDLDANTLAAFIVKACNLHDELVGALKIVRVSIELGQKLPSGVTRTVFNDVEVEQFKAILDKARGDKP